MRKRQSGKIGDDVKRWHAVLQAVGVTSTPVADREEVVEDVARAVQLLLDDAVELLQHVGDIADDAAALRAPTKQREAWVRLSDIQQIVDRVRVETAYLRSRGFLPCRFDTLQGDGPDQVDHVWKRADLVADSLGLTPAQLGFEGRAISLTSPPTPLRAWVADAVRCGAIVATQDEAERTLKLRRGLAKQRETARMTLFRNEAEGRRVLAEQQGKLLADLGFETVSV